ncbi:hypothetical protein C8R44DRAFT_875713 [Mycena epipterygia]|nr:hypothetical protein C8R44DRAFT_875713 [Mycena epipterygia]
MLLGCVLTTIPGYLGFPEAIEPGLLRIIVECVSLDFGKEIEWQLTRFLHKLLPENLVYYYVVLQVKLPLGELSETWQEFHALAKERIQLLDSAAKSATKPISSAALGVKHFITVPRRAR